MSSLGAHRRRDAAGVWHTLNHGVVTVPDATFLAGLAADAETGQTVWAEAEQTMYVFNGTQHIRVTGDALPDTTGRQPGEILTLDAARTPVWGPPVQSAVMQGIVSDSNNDPHEFLWTDLAALLPTIRAGSYLVVAHLDSALSAAVPGLTTTTPHVGDWLVAVDTDNDGVPEIFHIVAHDVQDVLPPMTGAVAGDLLGIRNPATNEAHWVKPPTGAGVPVGTVLMWPSTNFPNGHLLCDGQTFDASVYPQLRAVLGTNRLPDLRGQFIRGWGAPSGPSHTAPMLTQTGYATARPSIAFTGTAENAGEHRHGIWTVGHTYANSHGKGRYPSGNGGVDENSAANGAYTSSNATPAGEGAHTHTVSITGGGDAETRPVSTLLAFIIKALP